MKIGIYYAYWEKKWGVDYNQYVDRAADLGFDILEISCAGLKDLEAEEVELLAEHAKERGLILTGGYGPKQSENLASEDGEIVRNGFEFWRGTFPVLEKLGISVVGGGLYGCWPVDYTKPFDKEADLDRSIRNMRLLADMAADYGITCLGMEALNRHEGYMINCAKECRAYVDAVDKPNVRVHLDTYHMVLEEDSLTEAIRTAGEKLGHFHVGENNRRLPGQGHILDWKEIGSALSDVGYRGYAVMEPFVVPGGEIGRDIRLWRELLADSSPERLDQDAAASCKFLKSVLD